MVIACQTLWFWRDGPWPSGNVRFLDILGMTCWCSLTRCKCTHNEVTMCKICSMTGWPVKNGDKDLISSIAIELTPWLDPGCLATLTLGLVPLQPWKKLENSLWFTEMHSSVSLCQSQLKGRDSVRYKVDSTKSIASTCKGSQSARNWL